MSAMPLATWRGHVTVFRGAFTTAPHAELTNLSWARIGEIVAPIAGPTLTPEKCEAPYFLPCALRDAPLVGRTLERAIARRTSTIGRQRSAQHVTQARWIVADFDSVAREAFESAGRSLRRCGISAWIWTSYSIGRPDKPGIRARVAFPVDGSMDTATYAQAWHAANSSLFGGIADPTSARLSQQQGAWAIAPDRVRAARRWEIRAGVASLSALLALAPSRQEAVRDVSAARGQSSPGGVCSASLDQIRAAVCLFDPNDYTDWDAVLSLLVAISRADGSDEAALRAVAADFSRRARDDKQRRNDLPQYSPTARFDTWEPVISPGIAAATLFSRARDRALEICKRASQSGTWRGTRPAWEYLCAFHRRCWDEFYASMEAPV